MRANSASLVSIDFWNTLVIAHTGGDTRNDRRFEAVRDIAENHGIILSRKVYQKAHAEASRNFNKVWFNEQRTPGTVEMVKEMLHHLEFSVQEFELKYLVQVFENALLEGPPDLTPQVEEVLPQLANRYTLGVISDTMFTPGRVIRKYLHQKGISRYFSGFIFSDEVGFSKPNPQAFRKLLEPNHCRADESWHIGDLQKTDVTGAKNVGMQTILYTGITDNQEAVTTADYVLGTWEEIGELLLSN